uniref:Uncharacterized protein n=1 Tax=Psilocybe cubensis TaxID=181762 RepID=A0A8H7XW60_PSICU
MQRAPSEPYRSTSPFGPPLLDRSYDSQQPQPATSGQVPPGAFIVVCNPGPDGRPTYQQHKSVFASYQTVSGVLSGIQWVPSEAPSFIPPSGSHHVIVTGHDPNIWAQTYLNAVVDWQRSDAKKRKQGDKEANRYREQDGRNSYDYDRVSRELDPYGSKGRERSRSFSAGGATAPASIPFPGQGPTSGYPTHPSVAANGYPTNPYGSYGTPIGPPPPPVIPSGYPTPYSTHTRSRSGSFVDLTRQMKDMELDRNKEYSEARSRKSSAASRRDRDRDREYNTSESTYERARTISGGYPDRSNPNSYPPVSGVYPASVQPYGVPQTQGKYPPDPYSQGSRYAVPSPNMRPLDISSSYGAVNSGGYAGSDYSIAPSRTSGDGALRSTTPFGNPSTQVYPRGHILEGQPIINGVAPLPRSRAPSRAASSRAPSPSAIGKPSSYPSKSPHIPLASIPPEPQQLAAPEAFSRPINASNTFAPFEMIKVEDMDDICDPPYPKMPPVLTTHDIYHDDWKRCMQDLGRAWTGQLPVPSLKQNGLPPRKSTLAVDLISLWNQSFFYPRGVELLLYKGRERRTGPQAGFATVRLPKYDDTADSSSSSSDSSSDSEDSGYRKRMVDPYGRPLMGQAEMETRRRREEKYEEKRRRKEKKARKKAKAREKIYTIYIACLPQGPTAIPLANRAFGAGSAVSAGYSTSAYGPSATPAYGTPASITSGYGAPSATSVYGPPNANSVYGVPNANTSVAYGTPGGTYNASNGPAYGITSSGSAYGVPANAPGYGVSGATPAYGAPVANPAYGVPVGIPTTRSYGYGGGY